MSNYLQSVEIGRRMALLESGTREPSKFDPIVKARCICPNQGKPDELGYIAYSPSCLWPGHGVRTRWIDSPEIGGKEFLGDL